MLEGLSFGAVLALVSLACAVSLLQKNRWIRTGLVALCIMLTLAIGNREYKVISARADTEATVAIEAERQLTETRAALSDLQTLNATLSSDLQTANRTLDNLQAKIDAQTQALDILRGENIELSEALDAARRDLASALDESAARTDAAINEQSEADALQAQCLALPEGTLFRKLAKGICCGGTWQPGATLADCPAVLD